MTTPQHPAPGRPVPPDPGAGTAGGPLASVRAGRALTGPTAGRANAAVLVLLVLASLAQAWCLIEVGRALGLLVLEPGAAALPGAALATDWQGVGPGLLLRALLAAAVSALAAGVADGVSRRSAAQEEGVIRGRALTAFMRLGPGGADGGPGGPSGAGTASGAGAASTTSRAGAAVGLLTDGAERVARYRQTFLAPTAAAALAPLAVLVLTAVSVDWLSALVLTAAVVVVPWTVTQVHRRTRSSSGASRRRRAVLSARYLEVIQGLETLVLARAGGRAVAELEEAGEDNRRGLMRLLAGNQLVILLTDGLASLLLVVGAAALALVRVRSGAIGAGDGIALVLVSVVLLEPLDRVGSFFYVGMSGRANERLMLGLHRRAGNGPVPGTGRAARAEGVAGSDGGAGTTAGPRGAAVRLAGVTARWPAPPALVARHPGGHPGGHGAPTAPGRRGAPAQAPAGQAPAGEGHPGGHAPAAHPTEHGAPPARRDRSARQGRPSAPDVLTGVDLAVEPGERLAVVGPSGAGKSTLLALLDGDLLPLTGTVTVDGVTATHGDEAARDALRARSAVVAQTTWLFTGTIADNLRLADLDATDDELWAALAAAGLDAEVRTMPDGLATAVGERGTALSGGQAQRVALARAFLADRPLLLLDEPTSQVDLASEAVIVEALGRLGQGRTVVTVTHRRAAAEDADRVLTVEEGRLR
ncbi:ABC transporter ATP-binding protein [Actinomyces haliotis]|uniref:ABC transporter ATP-binding protein n=1 Tax=Actinomyces haliotis TaxID=1280843 RepID=UPI002B276AF3|nr:ABC transporter ATP-binding protein [Actinomyces haliotis]